MNPEIIYTLIRILSPIYKVSKYRLFSNKEQISNEVYCHTGLGILVIVLELVTNPSTIPFEIRHIGIQDCRSEWADLLFRKMYRRRSKLLIFIKN